MKTESTAVKLARLRLEAAQEALRVAEAEARQWYLDEEPEVGSMIMITAVFPGSPKQYEYLAYRPDKFWYITGREGSFRWDMLFHRMKAADITIKKLNFK